MNNPQAFKGNIFFETTFSDIDYFANMLRDIAKALQDYAMTLFISDITIDRKLFSNLLEHNVFAQAYHISSDPGYKVNCELYINGLFTKKKFPNYYLQVNEVLWFLIFWFTTSEFIPTSINGHIVGANHVKEDVIDDLTRYTDAKYYDFFVDYIRNLFPQFRYQYDPVNKDTWIADLRDLIITNKLLKERDRTPIYPNRTYYNVSDITDTFQEVTWDINNPHKADYIYISNQNSQSNQSDTSNTSDNDLHKDKLNIKTNTRAIFYL